MKPSPQVSVWFEAGVTTEVEDTSEDDRSESVFRFQPALWLQ